MECFFLRDWSFVLLLLPWSVSGKFTVIGPQQQIIALLDGEATFPCHLSPQMDAQDMNVIWFYGQSSNLVHQYKNKQDYLKHQHQDYKGRTEFLRHDISNGSVALKLRHIRPFDEGNYRCFFETPYVYEEAEFQVYVAGKGSTLHIHIKSDGNKEFQLICTSSGWYPEPEVQWRKNLEKSSSQDTKIMKDEKGLFSVETSVTVSTDSKVNVSCFIWNHLLKQGLEASVSLPDALSPFALSPNDPPWKVIVIVIMALMNIVLIILIVTWKLKKGKGICKDESRTAKVESGMDKHETDSFLQPSAESNVTTMKKKEATGASKDAIDLQSVQKNRGWFSRIVERIKGSNTQEWANPGNIQNEQRRIDPSSLSYRGEVQEGEQKKMEGNLHFSTDTWKRPDLQSAQKNRGWFSRIVERIKGSNTQEWANPGNIQNEQRRIDPSSLSYRGEVQEGEQKKMEGNLHFSTDTWKRPDLQSAQKNRGWSSRNMERIKGSNTQEWANPGNIQNEQRRIHPSSLSYRGEVQEGEQKKMQGNLSFSTDTWKRPDLQSAQKHRDWSNRNVERIKGSNTQEWANPGNIQNERRRIDPSSLSYRGEVQEGEQKKMEGNLHFSTDTWKRPDLQSAQKNRGWSSRNMERIKGSNMQEWANPGNIQNEQRRIDSFSLSYRGEVQEGEQKKMQGNLSFSTDTWKRPDLQSAQKNRGWSSRNMERMKGSNTQEWANPGNIQNEQRRIDPSSLSYRGEVQEGEQKKMEGNLHFSTDTWKSPDLQSAQKNRGWSSRNMERIKGSNTQEWANPGNIQNEQRRIHPYSLSYRGEVQEREQKKMEGNLHFSTDTWKRPDLQSAQKNRGWSSRNMERIKGSNTQEWANAGNIQNEQRRIDPSSLSYRGEVQEGEQKKMQGNLSFSTDTWKRPDLYTAKKY
ncbi:uncharacterized protein LOC127540545 isoform X2 [Antechinus flavipes]|uniref:uncharacterized protein LOC127540545 isoform X2 n=1 Tax=Antechinus flavipes TaxID=38775 RepID=UPI002235AB64|nr:uncharacterized protein LOC127540545 isoform X2 [Antechinus flavipes]